ncbi:lipopolysaccharide export system permease protein [Hypnocyclicus thermotrophus]|uniref:Lipopolysaccharide export system permease protein n=1 Tax=Hypnocyclicus thermotrophus TaxID=1627895 RepID=A0AA46DY14_9FUSO|nr:LptF/LptG family permease [Hypnocyclicus thermotrophus]TDT69206.1 lipopolysaccharide export system permease protein [Hypnocyclicus thermotrophus]
MLKKIDIYILKNFIKNWIMSLIGFNVIFILSQIFRIIGYVTQGEMTYSEALIYTLSITPDMIMTVLPLSILLGGLITVNKMATTLEITALKTSGISFFRIVRYPLIFTFTLSFGAFWFYNNVVPISNKKSRELRYEKVYNNLKISQIKADVFLKGEGNYLYYIRIINGEKNTIDNMELVLFDDELKKIKKIIVSKKGYFDIKKNNWILKEVVENDLENNETIFFNERIYDIIKEKPQDFLRDKIILREAKLNDLRDSANFIKRTGGDVSKLLVELNKRIAYPFATFVVSFLGLSLGSRFVRGASAISLALSIFLGYSYYVIQATLEALSIGGKINSFVGAWIPNLLFLVIGIYFLNKAEY